MAKKQSNVLAVCVWVVGLLGCFGYFNPWGFFALLIPLIFWLLGSKFTKIHCRTYFNVLITGTVLYFLGFAVNKLLIMLKVNISFDLSNIGIIYLIIMGIFGFMLALQNKRYKPEPVIRLF